MKPSIIYLSKLISFGLLVTITLLLAVATIVEKYIGSASVAQYFYTDPIMIAMWWAIAISGIIYLIARKIHKNFFTLTLHLAFVVILCGAMLTHILGEEGSLHLRVDADAVNTFTSKDKSTIELPFEVKLTNFELKYYAGTYAPMDYVSRLKIINNSNDTIHGSISMNKILEFNGYRFYQSGYDGDCKGTILSISHDPVGIAVTYSGYLLLLISMCGFFLQRGSSFRKLLSHSALKRVAMSVVFIALCTSTTSANNSPDALPRNVADKFGELYVYHNDRICPMSTLAKDFATKLCGKDSYEGFTSEQILTGWLFYYDDWKNFPIIKIKGNEVKETLGITSDRARLADFVSINGYKLDLMLQGGHDSKSRREAENINEKFSLASMAATGSLFKIFPFCPDTCDRATWYSLADKLPQEMPAEEWAFVRNCMSFVSEKIAMKDYNEVIALLEKIKIYQEKSAGTNGIPSKTKFSAEKIYNDINAIKYLAMICCVMGIFSFILYCRQLVTSLTYSKWLTKIFFYALCCIGAYLSILIVMRGYIANHLPLSNGFETMQFMAWCSVILAIILHKKIPMAVPMGYLVGGLSLMVAMMGESNPQITQLMPVLHSPLLSIHVAAIMIAYSLLAFMMINGVTAVVLHFNSTRNHNAAIEQLYVISRIMLYPAVFLLCAGIFIGAVWANVSWGRYWGWDPKEVWALITMIIYAFPLHATSLPALHKHMKFHIFCIIAFLSVLITYFGVNFVLGGLHSYA